MDGAAIINLAHQEETARELERYTEVSQGRGVFGSPFYIVGEEVFWGQYRLEFVEDVIARASGNTSRRRMIVPTQGARM